MENLKTLSTQVERRRQLLVLEDSVEKQLLELTEKKDHLRRQWEKENLDVERLEKGGLAAWLYELMGTKEEKLEKEHREAVAAAGKYHTALAELDSLRRRQASIQAELRELQDCEYRFAQAKQRRAAELKAANDETGRKIVEYETTLGSLATQKRELQEALDAGSHARVLAEELQSELDHAEDLGAWDLLGGGMLVDLAKHEHLDRAQALVEQLQSQLRQFRTELADVDIQLDLDIHIDSILRFADWFFDGLFVDWTVQSRIEDAQDRVSSVLEQIERCLSNLTSMQEDLAARTKQTGDLLEQLLLETSPVLLKEETP